MGVKRKNIVIRQITGNGFTLIELLISIALFGILALGFMTLYVNSYQMVLFSGEQEDALYGSIENIEGMIADSSSITTSDMTVIMSIGDIDVVQSGARYVADELVVFLPE